MKIINKCSKKSPVNIESKIRKLLRVIPEEDLVGLDSIIILNEPPNKHKNVRGLYWQKHKLQPARVEIYINNIYGEYGFRKILLPFGGSLLLANVLFHELGHHCRYRSHGVPKAEKEKFAEQYRKKYIQKAFHNYWRFYLKPLKPIINLVFRINV